MTEIVLSVILIDLFINLTASFHIDY